jgi:hypothetical protein
MDYRISWNGIVRNSTRRGDGTVHVRCVLLSRLRPEPVQCRRTRLVFEDSLRDRVNRHAPGEGQPVLVVVNGMLLDRCQRGSDAGKGATSDVLAGIPAESARHKPHERRLKHPHQSLVELLHKSPHGSLSPHDQATRIHPRW